MASVHTNYYIAIRNNYLAGLFAIIFQSKTSKMNVNALNTHLDAQVISVFVITAHPEGRAAIQGSSC